MAAQEGQSLSRHAAAVVVAMAVSPLVVARRVDQRRGETPDLHEPRQQQRVVAALGARFDVSDMDSEADLSVGVDLVDQRVKARLLGGADAGVS